MKYNFIVLLALLVLPLVSCADYDVGRKALGSKDYVVAKENLEPLALTYDHTDSKVALADLYLRTEPSETHGNKARILLEESAPIKEGKAYYLHGRIYEDGYGADIDGPRAMSLYQKAVDTGYWRAKYNMAKLYSQGEIVPKDYLKAETLFVNVIDENGYDRARKDLLKMRAERAIENVNIVDAEEYLTEMINAGDDKAVSKLAKFLRENVQDGSKDEKIISLYKMAAQKDGTGKGWFDLGRLYENGDFKTLEPNGLKALEAYKQASQKGYWRANYFVGRLYDRGRIVEGNRNLAMQYYNKTLESQPYEPAQNAIIKLKDKIAKGRAKSTKKEFK